MSWWDWFDKETKFIKKIKQGIVLYTKPNNELNIMYYITQFIVYYYVVYYRRVTSKRIFTHTKK